ncbi:hypothetical protein HU200_000574 [Digitaria exilis]|uniref:Uncharacterized protein n=1 Tax=Digitaria exilis TaxID=1010633 RepID=A0A835FYP0_9POAL|nr:hypothetical protein HU200_000574 [Digitaria exilis]
MSLSHIFLVPPPPPLRGSVRDSSASLRLLLAISRPFPGLFPLLQFTPCTSLLACCISLSYQGFTSMGAAADLTVKDLNKCRLVLGASRVAKAESEYAMRVVNERIEMEANIHAHAGGRNRANRKSREAPSQPRSGSRPMRLKASLFMVVSAGLVKRNLLAAGPTRKAIGESRDTGLYAVGRRRSHSSAVLARRAPSRLSACPTTGRPKEPGGMAFFRLVLTLAPAERRWYSTGSETRSTATMASFMLPPTAAAGHCHPIPLLRAVVAAPAPHRSSRFRPMPPYCCPHTPFTSNAKEEEPRDGDTFHMQGRTESTPGVEAQTRKSRDSAPILRRNRSNHPYVNLGSGSARARLARLGSIPKRAEPEPAFWLVCEMSRARAGSRLELARARKRAEPSLKFGSFIFPSRAEPSLHCSKLSRAEPSQARLGSQPTG